MNNKKKQGLALIFACLFMVPWSLWANPYDFTLKHFHPDRLVLRWSTWLTEERNDYIVYAHFNGKTFSQEKTLNYYVEDYKNILFATLMSVSGAPRGAVYTAVVHVHKNGVSQDRMMSSWGRLVYGIPSVTVPYSSPKNIQVNTDTPRKVIITWSNHTANFPDAHYVVTISGEGVNAEQKTTTPSLTYSGDFKGNQTYTISIKAVDPKGHAPLDSPAATHKFTHPDYDPHFTFQNQPFLHEKNASCSHSCQVQDHSQSHEFCILDTPEAQKACTDLKDLLSKKRTSITSLSYDPSGGGINLTAQSHFSSFVPQKSFYGHSFDYSLRNKELNSPISEHKIFPSIQSESNFKIDVTYGASYQVSANNFIMFGDIGKELTFNGGSETKSITVPLLPPSHVDVTYKDNTIMVQASDHDKNQKDFLYYYFVLEGPGVTANVNSNDSGFGFFEKDFQEGGVYSVTAFSKNKNSSSYDSKTSITKSITIPYQPPQAPQDLQFIVQDAQVLVYWQHPEEGKTFNYVWRLTDDASSEEILNGSTSEKSLLFNLDAFKKDAAYTLSLHSEKNNLKSEVITGSFSTPPEPVEEETEEVTEDVIEAVDEEEEADAEVPPSGDNNDGDSSANMTRVDPNNPGSSGGSSSPSGGTNASVTSTPSSGSSQTSPNGSSSNTSPNGSTPSNTQTPLPQGKVAMPIRGCAFGML